MLDVIWEDPHGLAVIKPAGLPTHPRGAGDDGPTLEGMVRRHLRPDDPESVYLGIVHRLDRPVSGVLLCAKTPKAAQRWGAAFAGRRVEKEYWAVVETTDPAATLAATWDDWIADPDREGRARIYPTSRAGTVRATTRVEPGTPGRFALSGPLMWIRLFPATGRTHQLRAQAAARGRPIAGDATYGSATPFGPGIALHARSLVVEHPIRRVPLRFTARLPATWSGWTTDLD